MAKEDSALVNEVRAAGHQKTAAKLAVLESLRMDPRSSDHRELTPDEIKAQNEAALNVHQLRAAQAVEYGTWVAAEDIYVGTALAYAAGQPVPVSNVEQHGYGELGIVARVASEPPAPAPAPAAKAMKASA